jgi:hypothetical protein
MARAVAARAASSASGGYVTSSSNEPVRRSHDDARIADAAREHVREPADRTTSVADRDRGPDDGTDHRVAEGIGDDAGDDETVGVPCPGVLDKGADRRRALPTPAERGEVVQPEQGAARLRHGGDVEGPGRRPRRGRRRQRLDAGGSSQSR